ncbi:hypothetical protein ES703_09240 [subsurface metagenome]
MYAAVDLNHQPFFVAVEIHNAVANGVLPQKLQAIQFAVAQCLPEQFFRPGLPFTQSTGGCLQWLDTVMLPELTGGLIWMLPVVLPCLNHMRSGIQTWKELSSDQRYRRRDTVFSYKDREKYRHYIDLTFHIILLTFLTFSFTFIVLFLPTRRNLLLYVPLLNFLCSVNFPGSISPGSTW